MLKKQLDSNKKAIRIILSPRDIKRLKLKDNRLEQGEIKGGFIAKYKDYEINRSIDSIMKLNEHVFTREVGKTLFS